MFQSFKQTRKMCKVDTLEFCLFVCFSFILTTIVVILSENRLHIIIDLHNFFRTVFYNIDIFSSTIIIDFFNIVIDNRIQI